jgi:UDP-2-acetamido-2,6-beta-L-arabino-hexul-4-ose reductase
MLRIGITGQEGFVGKHLYNTLSLLPDEFESVEYHTNFFKAEEALDKFVAQCDAIVHLAAMNRHESEEVLYNTNIELVQKIIASLERTKSRAHVLFSSSSQEERDNSYGKSKKEGRILLEEWAKNNGGTFTGLVIPNVFGPFGKPNYNSVVATFSHKIANGDTPQIHVDGEIKLIYVGELVAEILNKVREKKNESHYNVPHTSVAKVSQILALLQSYIVSHFPVTYTKHTDPRGSFVEIIRLGIGGQVSFSTTVSGITRGNHFHTRKIERFAVIKGKALIQLRRIGTDEVLDFYLDGNEPSYVDMPIWYTHNIKNIGEEVLYTNFWINEAYNPEDADTYFVEV